MCKELLLLLQRTMCYHTEQRETTVRVAVSETSQAVAAASPTDEDVIAGHNPLQQMGKPTLLLHTNAMHKQRGNLNFNL